MTYIDSLDSHESYADTYDVDDVELNEDEKRKVIAQRNLAELREFKEQMEDFNTKYDLAELDLSLVLSIRSKLRLIDEVLDEINSDVSEIHEDVKDARTNARDYIVKHEKYVDGDEDPESPGLSPYIAFTSLRMDLSNLTYRADKSEVWLC